MSIASYSFELIRSIISNRRSIVSRDNIDKWRFGQLSTLNINSDDMILDFIDDIITKKDIYNNSASIYSDDESRNILTKLLCFRALGNGRIILPSNTPAYWRNYEIGEGCRIKSSNIEVPPFEFSLYSLLFFGNSIELECWLGNVVFSFLAKQYFLDRNGITIKPEIGDHVIDAGGCFGDTALAFAAAVGESGRVFSFEPLPRFKEIFESNMSRNDDLWKRIRLVEFALSDRSGPLFFDDYGAGSKLGQGGTIKVNSITIDEFVNEQNLTKVDFIKMDIEGAEREALRGAKDTITRFRPKLAISAYHRADDLLFLPAFIKELEPRYEIYLDHYTIHNEESVLYARAP